MGPITVFGFILFELVRTPQGISHPQLSEPSAIDFTVSEFYQSQAEALHSNLAKRLAGYETAIESELAIRGLGPLRNSTPISRASDVDFKAKLGVLPIVFVDINTAGNESTVTEIKTDPNQSISEKLSRGQRTNLSWPLIVETLSTIERAIDSTDSFKLNEKIQSLISFKERLRIATTRMQYLSHWSNDPKLLEFSRVTLRKINTDTTSTAGNQQNWLPKRKQKQLSPLWISEKKIDATRQITLKIVTDINDKKFISEIEGALNSHWNDSAFAKREHLEFRIEWLFVKGVRAEVNLATWTLEKHLSFLAAQADLTWAILTTGASTISTVSVEDLPMRALVLSPISTRPRELAHELGHLLGYSDCYFRFLTHHSPLGVDVTEIENPVYDQELMCNSISGTNQNIEW